MPKKTEETPVARLRAHLELSQEDFANALSVSQGTVSGWENSTGPSGPYAARILGKYHREMKAIGISQLDLLTQGNASG